MAGYAVRVDGGAGNVPTVHQLGLKGLFRQLLHGVHGRHPHLLGRTSVYPLYRAEWVFLRFASLFNCKCQRYGTA